MWQRWFAIPTIQRVTSMVTFSFTPRILREATSSLRLPSGLYSTLLNNPSGLGAWLFLAYSHSLAFFILFYLALVQILVLAPTQRPGLLCCYRNQEIQNFHQLLFHSTSFFLFLLFISDYHMIYVMPTKFSLFILKMFHWFSFLHLSLLSSLIFLC